MFELLYNVAGHLFEINLEDLDMEEKWLRQYRPFSVYDKNSSAPLFTCQISSSSISISEKAIKVYQDNGPKEYSLFEIYDQGSGYIIKSAVTKTDKTLFLIGTSKEYKHSTIYLGKEQQKDKSFDNKARFIIENYLRLIYAQNTSVHNTICVHSSTVELSGKAYMFIGRSGAGKSTHSKLWLEKFSNSAQLINDDNPVIRLKEDEIMVYGSPWSGKTPCYKNISYPLGGLAHIVQGPENEIHKYQPIDAYRILRDQCAGFSFIDKYIADGIFKTCERIVSLKGIYKLTCLPNEEACALCKNALEK